MLGLFGESVTIMGLLIPRVLQMAFRVCTVAVAVRTMVRTLAGIKLLTSPTLSEIFLP